jgi:hypothetical protein
MRIGRNSDYRGLRRLLVTAAIASGALLALAVQAHGAPSMDYGDAPDGADARYSIAVAGEFPSLAASSGPRHLSSGPSLGIGRDKEGDSKQVDRDRFDDGVSLDRIRRCKTSQVTVLVDTRRIPARLLRKRDLYLNAWFDWDRSGSWGEVNGCPTPKPLLNNEWSIVNQKFSGKSFLKQRVRAYTLRFKGGLHSHEFWTRFTLTLGQKLPINAASRSGGATGKPYAYGETEDYLYRGSGPPPIFPPEEDDEGKEKEKEKEIGGPFRASCLPNPIFVEHGRAASVRFFIRDEGKGHIFGKQLSPKRPGGNATRILRHSNQRGVPMGYFRAAGFRFKSNHRDARHNPVERHVVKFLFTRGKSKQVLECLVNIVHDKIVKPKKPHRPAAVAPRPQQKPIVRGFGAYQQNSEFPQNYNMVVQFDQDVGGFRIKLKGGPPPNVTFAQALPPTPGDVKCEKADAGSVLCTGALKAGVQAHLVVQFDTKDPTGLEGRFELWAIQDGKEVGPFPMQKVTGATK